MALIRKSEISGDLGERVIGAFDQSSGLVDAKSSEISTHAHPHTATKCPTQSNGIDSGEIPELRQRPSPAWVVMQSFAYEVHPRRSRSLRAIVLS